MTSSIKTTKKARNKADVCFSFYFLIYGYLLVMQVGIHELTFFFKMNPWAPERKIGLTWASAPFSRKSSVYNAKGRHYSFVRADYAGIAISAHCRMTQPAAKMVCVMELLDHGARSAEGQVTGKIWSHGGFWYHTNPKGPEYVTHKDGRGAVRPVGSPIRPIKMTLTGPFCDLQIHLGSEGQKPLNQRI